MNRLKEAMLLIYSLDDSGKHGMVVFVRSGTHSELFS
jgi:mRNA interferase YafQ